MAWMHNACKENRAHGINPLPLLGKVGIPKTIIMYHCHAFKGFQCTIAVHTIKYQLMNRRQPF